MLLAEPPIITEPPLEGQKAAEGQTTALRCSVFGSPKPLVVWKKGNEQLTGGRFSVLENGHLEIVVTLYFNLRCVIYNTSITFLLIHVKLMILFTG